MGPTGAHGDPWGPWGTWGPMGAMVTHGAHGAHAPWAHRGRVGWPTGWRPAAVDEIITRNHKRIIFLDELTKSVLKRST